MSTPASHPRTLWEEGRKPGRLVVLVAALATLVVVLLDLALFDHLALDFDIAFVLVCAGAALAVRPRDFFVVGVLPPLLLAATVGVLAISARGTVSDPTDGFLQATVSGLAHHASALIAGYALTLVLLAIRQTTLRRAGMLRRRPRLAAPSPQRPSSR